MKKIKKIRQVQFGILTTIIGYFREGKELTKNPFYRCDINTVKKDIKKAREVYKDIFQYGIMPSWCAIKADSPDVETVLAKVKAGEVEPMPNYEEMKELRII